MAELLVKAVDAVNSDPDADRAGCFKKGDIVVAMDDGHAWRPSEAPPTFVIVKCPGLDLATARDRIQRWDYAYEFTILQRSVPLDGWRFKVVNTQMRADNAGAPKLAAVQGFFDHWGASYVRLDADGPVFDWKVQDGARSAGFLGTDPASVGVTISETAYDQSTGWHTFTIDVSSLTSRQQIQVARRITGLGGEILDASDLSATTYRLPRDRVVAELKDAVQSARTPYKIRRYSFAPADVDTVLAAGGGVTVTLAQLTAKVIDARGA